MNADILYIYEFSYFLHETKKVIQSESMGYISCKHVY